MLLQEKALTLFKDLKVKMREGKNKIILTLTNIGPYQFKDKQSEASLQDITLKEWLYHK